MKQIAIIGCGSMGGGLALLFAENGLHVSLKDTKVEIIDDTIEKARADGFGERVHKFTGGCLSQALSARTCVH